MQTILIGFWVDLVAVFLAHHIGLVHWKLRGASDFGANWWAGFSFGGEFRRISKYTVWCWWEEGGSGDEMRERAEEGLGRQQWQQCHWVFVIQEAMDHCNSFICWRFRPRLPYPPVRLFLRCPKRRRVCSIGSVNSPAARRLECCSCVLSLLQFLDGFCMLAKVW